MQMIVAVLILPSLLVMSHTPFYLWLRIGGAIFAGVAAIAWIVERLFDIQTPVDAIVNSLAQYCLSAAFVLVAMSLAVRYLPEKNVVESRDLEMSA
jgi:hypothetical protein